jgi:hypothetical protein
MTFACFKNTLCAALLLALSFTAGAQTETRLASQAIHCAAVFTVLVQVNAADAALSARLNKAVDMFTDVYTREFSPQADLAQASQRQGVALADIKSNWTSRAPQFLESGVICGAWAEGFLEQGDWYKHIPVYPKVVAMHIRAQYHALAEDALKRWQP